MYILTSISEIGLLVFTYRQLFPVSPGLAESNFKESAGSPYFRQSCLPDIRDDTSIRHTFTVYDCTFVKTDRVIELPGPRGFEDSRSFSE